jgi:O-acetyl-ADP-ribose deacetylase (regulator of RNase III)
MSHDPPPSSPTHEALVVDLKVVREKGLIRLRRLELPALSTAAACAGLASGPARDPRAEEELLRRAVAALGDDDLGSAAGYLFGLVRGTVGWRPKDLRERAASYYGLSAESFRKEPEQLLIGRVAEEILRICDRPEARSRTQPARLAEPAAPASTQDLLLRHLDRLLTEPEPDDAGVEPHLTIGPLYFAQRGSSLTVHQAPMEELTGIHVLVSSENTFLEAAKPYKSSLSAHLRRAAAIKSPGGAILEDVVATELRAWMADNGRPGLSVEAGCVAPTSPGRLARRGVRRLYHAAIAHPRPGTNDYDVDLEALGRAVTACLELGRQERRGPYPDLRSMCFPLFGAGRGGVEPGVSFSRMWTALGPELAADASWDLHVCARFRHETAAVLRHLYVVAAQGGQHHDNNVVPDARRPIEP